MQVVKVMKRGQVAAAPSLPFQLQHLRAYQDGKTLVVESRRGMSVSCNLAYRICQLRVSGGKSQNFLTCKTKSWEEQSEGKS